ncbi:MAG: septal ring lytic transglycosylase RlpA family protein [Myxococcota bacterium]
MAAFLVLLFAAVGCRGGRPDRPSGDFLMEGVASYYGEGFHGRLTASGERFDKNQMTAAHPKLKFGTCLRVRHLANGREVKVRVNDRGPFAGGRIIDLSEGAARKLGMLEEGVTRVRLSRCDEPPSPPGRGKG